ncbi:MAG TPA: hypothetical protein PKA41_04175 [Verrucomicrobiota bacterium]|nr:hypothetical protein [Verrucomicrobiota bacterium]
MKSKSSSSACLLGFVLGVFILHGSVSAADLIVRSAGRIIIRTNVLLNSGSFVVEPDGAVDMNLSAKVTATNFVYGGVLTAISTGGAPSPGESFELFDAPAYSGTFTAVNLPFLGSGHYWVNTLKANGSVSVSLSSEPTFTSITRVSGSSVKMEFTAAAGQGYAVLATTNLSLPLFSWTMLGNATQTSPGQYQFIDTTVANLPFRYYRLMQP